MQKGGDVEVQVTKEDQANINTFGRLNNRMHELDDDLARKKVHKIQELFSSHGVIARKTKKNGECNM